MVNSLRPTIVGRSAAPVTPQASPATGATGVGTTATLPAAGGDGSPAGYGGVPAVNPTLTPAPIIQPGSVVPGADEGDTGGSVGSDFATLNAEALEAALAAIEAEYGLNRAQLLAEQSAIGEEYRYLYAQAQRARTQGLEQVSQSAQ